MLNIPVIVGSTREGRNTPRLARLLHRQLQARADTRSELVDLGALDLPIIEERLRNLEDPPAGLVDFARSMGAADAVVITSPEYNKGYPAVLKNAVDGLGAELRRKPVGIACHSVGAFGGTVVLQMLRPVLLGLGAVPIPASMTVPKIVEAIDLEGNALEPVHEERAGRFLDELVWYAAALKAAGESSSAT